MVNEELVREGFDFNAGTLGANLATFDHDVQRYMERATDLAATEGELAMFDEAPWRDRTGDARRGLWANGSVRDKQVQLNMGHSVRYGVYLEKYHGGRFQVITPVLVRTGEALMRSMQAMFAEMGSESATPPVVLASGGTRPGISRSPRAYVRDAKGRFISNKNKVVGIGHAVKDITKSTRRTRIK